MVKMILNMLHTLIEQMILPLKDALNLIKRFKAKRPYQENTVMQRRRKFSHRKFTPYLMRTAL
jgi:hypothetical protein